MSDRENKLQLLCGPVEVISCSDEECDAMPKLYSQEYVDAIALEAVTNAARVKVLEAELATLRDELKEVHRDRALTAYQLDIALATLRDSKEVKECPTNCGRNIWPLYEKSDGYAGWPNGRFKFCPDCGTPLSPDNTKEGEG
jgi:hypothetical protein